MTGRIDERIDSLFERALELDRAEQSAFLAEACGDDDRLRAEVESLLAHDAEASKGFMQTPEPIDGSKVEPRTPLADRLVGRRIARYTIRGVIASGGMGTVYEAEQENPRRIIALKVMRAGVTSSYVLHHFERESEILARLHHPHIAQVYEAGMFEDAAIGRRKVPYFAMEYIPDARSITRYAAEQGLATRRRLELFIQVCDAVHHGHQMGIIHRDLKPGNILVDAAGQVKVIDFGVARSTDSDVAVTTMRTDVDQLVGTLQYMSPEQCEADPLGLDTRSDVYALGVVLYELLTGRLPYDVGRRAVHSAARVICEQPPERPGLLDRRLRGDLEIIILKTLEKDRNNRYASAADLGRDLQRYLRREPIEAKPPSLWTRTCHRVTRHPLLATAVLCALLIIGSIGGVYASVYFLARQPIRAEIRDGYRRAVLLSRDGHVLHEWGTGRRGSVTFAEMVEQPDELGGARLVLIGMVDDRSALYFGRLLAYDVDKNLDEPIWERFIEDEQVPRALQVRRGFKGEDFYVHFCRVADVFPDLPGPELIAVHQHDSTTHSALRIYDLSGRLLYQVWIDAYIQGLYWMSDSELLVIVGMNGAALWPGRGHPEVMSINHPSVVFAIRPKKGFRTTEYLREAPGDDPLSPVWYKCLLPAEEAVKAQLNVIAPTGRFDPGRFAKLILTIWKDDASQTASFTVTLDDQGNMVPKSRILTNGYLLNRAQLPDPDIFKLGKLDPIVPKTRQTDDASPPTGNNR